jgi:hypothetical protein
MEPSSTDTIMSCWSRTGIMPPNPAYYYDNIDNFLNLPMDDSDSEVIQELIDRL